MKKSLRIAPLLLIVLFACVLRTYKISSIPPALSWDEVSIGYNAFSILKTGKDEHGRFLPLDTFIAYGDYKPPLAIYLTVPFVAVFGLNEIAVRLPSAIAGVVTVLLTFFLVSELLKYAFRHTVFKTGKVKEPFVSIRKYLPLLSSLLLAISPWHINISRAGFEANIALMFSVLGIYLIFRALEKPKTWLVAWLPFVCAFYTFNSARYFSPMFGLVLCIIFRNAILKNRKYFFIGVVIAGICLIPIIPHVFSDISIVQTSNTRIVADGGSFLGKIIHNRRVGYAIEYFRHFADNFQPWFFFIRGDGNPKFSIQEVGQLYFIEAPLLFIGIFSLFSLFPQIGSLVLLWVIVAIIPAATARETPHALRILNTLPVWQICIGFGILTVLGWVGASENGKKHQRIVFCASIAGITLIYLFNVGYYLHSYYVHYAKTYSNEWQYGYRQALEYTQTIENTYDTIYLSETIGRPYMYTLFYTTYDPNTFLDQKNSSFDSAGFYHVYGFGKYKFIRSFPTGEMKPKTLYVVDPGWVPEGVHILKTISTLEGIQVLTIFDK
jgi:4-amino-4-deoxy-L-arabinose transferase-like glycosyltransferase